MGRRLTTILAGIAVLALVVLAVVALTTQTGQASAQAGQSSNGAASVQPGAGGQECGDCPGQVQGAAAEDPGDGAPAPDCDGCGVQQDAVQGAAEGDAQGDGGGCCPY